MLITLDGREFRVAELDGSDVVLSRRRGSRVWRIAGDRLARMVLAGLRVAAVSG